MGSTVYEDLALVAFRGDIAVWAAPTVCVLLRAVAVVGADGLLADVRSESVVVGDVPVLGM